MSLYPMWPQIPHSALGYLLLFLTLPCLQDCLPTAQCLLVLRPNDMPPSSQVSLVKSITPCSPVLSNTFLAPISHCSLPRRFSVPPPPSSGPLSPPLRCRLHLIILVTQQGVNGTSCHFYSVVLGDSHPLITLLLIFNLHFSPLPTLYF